MSWVSLEEDQIGLGYWGKYVNIELLAVCKCEAERWEISEIYYGVETPGHLRRHVSKLESIKSL